MAKITSCEQCKRSLDLEESQHYETVDPETGNSTPHYVCGEDCLTTAVNMLHAKRGEKIEVRLPRSKESPEEKRYPTSACDDTF